MTRLSDIDPFVVRARDGVCQSCPFRPASELAQGSCPCVDGEPTIRHIASGDCPRGRFDNIPVPPPVRLSTSRVATQAVPEGFDPRHSHLDSGGTEPCSC